jgi:hypothetical protein
MKKVLARRVLAWATLNIILALTLPARADSVTNLNPGESINLATVLANTGVSVQIGDKLFGDFFFSYVDTDGTALNDLIASNVVLTALSNQVGFGLSFQTPLITVSNVVKDLVLKYSAQVLAEGFAISDVHLAFTSSVGGLGTATIGESVFTNGFGGDAVGALSVFNPGNPAKFSDVLLLAQPQQELWLQKDILVSGNGDSISDMASVTIIDQTFSQVPEPASVTLAAVGLLGLICLHRRRR